MSSRKTKYKKRRDEDKTEYETEYGTEYKTEQKQKQKNLDEIAAASYAGEEDLGRLVYSAFGLIKRKKRGSRDRRHKLRTKRSKRRSRNRSFGAFEGTTDNLKRFLVIVAFILLRSAIKGNLKNTVYEDVGNAEIQTLNFLTITSLLELLGVLVGKENRDKIVFAYMLYSIGSDVSKLV